MLKIVTIYCCEMLLKTVSGVCNCDQSSTRCAYLSIFDFISLCEIHFKFILEFTWIQCSLSMTIRIRSTDRICIDGRLFFLFCFAILLFCDHLTFYFSTFGIYGSHGILFQWFCIDILFFCCIKWIFQY